MGFFDLLDILWFVFILGGIPILIIWLVVMNKAIDQVSHDIRRMEPGAVWLCLIPLFGFVWQFLVTNAVAEGIAKEMQVRNMFPNEAKPGYGFGLTGCILLCCIIIPYAGVGFGMIGLILMIVHMVKISEYNKILAQSGRWETRYHQRMAELRQQQGISAYQYGTPQHWPQQQPTPPPQTYTQPQPPPPSYYNPDDLNPYKKKDKPKNPFG